jgi:predicted DNA-binding protein YlxM (UPF0122 family)
MSDKSQKKEEQEEGEDQCTCLYCTTIRELHMSMQELDADMINKVKKAITQSIAKTPQILNAFIKKHKLKSKDQLILSRNTLEYSTAHSLLEVAALYTKELGIGPESFLRLFASIFEETYRIPIIIPKMIHLSSQESDQIIKNLQNLQNLQNLSEGQPPEKKEELN